MVYFLWTYAWGAKRLCLSSKPLKKFGCGASRVEPLVPESSGTCRGQPRVSVGLRNRRLCQAPGLLRHAFAGNKTIGRESLMGRKHGWVHEPPGNIDWTPWANPTIATLTVPAYRRPIPQASSSESTTAGGLARGPCQATYMPLRINGKPKAQPSLKNTSVLFRESNRYAETETQPFLFPDSHLQDCQFRGAPFYVLQETLNARPRVICRHPSLALFISVLLFHASTLRFLNQNIPRKRECYAIHGHRSQDGSRRTSSQMLTQTRCCHIRSHTRPSGTRVSALVDCTYRRFCVFWCRCEVELLLQGWPS